MTYLIWTDHSFKDILITLIECIIAFFLVLALKQAYDMGFFSRGKKK